MLGTPRRVVNTITAIAHRGDPLGACENTPAAFASAVAFGVDMVELDLRRTRDGEIVVLHDQSLLRLWGRDISVGDLGWAEVAQLGANGVRIPLLREVLTAVALPLMIDFTRREVVEGALAAVDEAGALERSLFVSGNVAGLSLLRKLSGEARIGLTWTETGAVPVALLAELRAEYWNPTFGLVSAEAVDTVHETGRRVSTWTVDAPEDMVRVREAGVDAIVSNRVAQLLRFLGRA
jgi:glycerophosphoryl diester phosphodiesterase